MVATLDTAARMRICHRCQKRPDGCWQARDFRSPKHRLESWREATAASACPLGLWDARIDPDEAEIQAEHAIQCAPPQRPLLPSSHRGPVDVVYFLGSGSKYKDDWELRYSLRSIVANFADLNRVVIVGHRPAWLAGVVHLDVPDSYKHCKDANLYAKLLAACRWGVTDWFLNPSDDQMILRPHRFADARAWHVGDMRTYPDDYWLDNKWKDRLRNTRDWLLAHGGTTYNHDGHVPMPIHRDTFLAACAPMPYDVQPGFTIHTGYFNQVPVPREALGNKKWTQGHACHLTNNIAANLDGRLFLGYNNAGMTEAFQWLIEHRFPNPSPFEADARTVVAQTASAPGALA